jgi:vancomycin resistance protein YoaR
VLLAVVGAVGLLVVAYVLAWVAVGPGVARGTTVLGVPIGGLSTAEAARTLDRELADEATAKIAVRAGSREVTIAPRRAGLALDAAATAESAPSRSWNPAELVDALLGDDEVAAVAAVDRGALREAVRRLAGRVDRPAVDGQVRLTRQAEVRAVAAEEGVRVRREAAGRALVAAYLSSAHVEGKPVRVPAVVEQPAVSQAEVDRVTTEIAEPAVSAPVAVTVEASTVQLAPQDIARSLTFEADDRGTLQPRLDGARLHAALADDLAPVEEPAKDATFDVSSGRPRVVPSAQGREVLPETLAGAVLPVLTQTGAARAVSVPLEVSEPDVDTATAESLGVRELVSEYTTYYPSDFAPRLTNIHRAADFMDGTLVLPATCSASTARSASGRPSAASPRASSSTTAGSRSTTAAASPSSPRRPSTRRSSPGSRSSSTTRTASTSRGIPRVASRRWRGATRTYASATTPGTACSSPRATPTAR